MEEREVPSCLHGAFLRCSAAASSTPESAVRPRGRNPEPTRRPFPSQHPRATALASPCPLQSIPAKRSGRNWPLRLCAAGFHGGGFKSLFPEQRTPSPQLCCVLARKDIPATPSSPVDKAQAQLALQISQSEISGVLGTRCPAPYVRGAQLPGGPALGTCQPLCPGLLPSQ